MIRLGICTSIDHAAVMKKIGYEPEEAGAVEAVASGKAAAQKFMEQIV